MSLLFVFASLGVVNGILLSVYLILKQERVVTDIYFGGLLLALSIRIGKSALVHFDPPVDRLILQIGLSACVFIGPFFYCYLNAIKQERAVFQKRELLILLGLFLLIVGIGTVFPYRSYPEVWNGVIVYGIYGVWAIFVGLGLYEGRTILQKAFRTPAQLTERDRYLLAIMVGVVFITCTFQFALFIRGFTYIWGALAFTVLFYYLLGRALLSKKVIVPKTPSVPKLENATALMQQVDTWMCEQKPFTQQKLKLDELAMQVGMSRHLLSRLLNEEYGRGYAQYLKTYRIEEAKRLIATRSDLSLEGIGYEAGFSSKSAFFAAFKQLVQTTPAEYKKSLPTAPKR